MKAAANRVVEYEFQIVASGAATVRHVIKVPFAQGWITGQRYSRSAGATGTSVVRGFNHVNATEGAMDDTIDQIIYHDAGSTDGIFSSGPDFGATTDAISFCCHDATDATTTVDYDSTTYTSTIRGWSVDADSESWLLTFELTTGAAETYDFAIQIAEDVA